MSYLLTQIWICLLLTALVAGLAGWLLGGTSKRKIKKVEDKWRADLARAENERDYYEGEMKNLKAVAEEHEDIEDRFLQEKESLEKELDALQKGMKFNAENSKEAEVKLTEKAQVLEDENTSLSARFEEEQQVFSQRLAELEAGAELDSKRLEDYEDKINELQSQLDSAHINMAETTNKLTEAEAKLGQAEYELSTRQSGSSHVAAGAALGAAAIATGLAGDHVEFDPDVEDYSIDAIEAISKEDAKRLKKLGIKTTSDLLRKASDKDSISLLAKSMGKEGWVVRSWASVADLLRVKGINAIDAELLELSGVATVQSLIRSKADKLVDSMKVIHRHVGKTTNTPNLEEIKQWVENATRLEPMLESNVDKL